MEAIDYLLIMLVAAIIIYAAYYVVMNYIYVPSISMNLKLNYDNLGKVYPFENIAVPLVINNTGAGPVKSMNIQLYINGAAYRYYTVTLPSGKETTVNFNFTPSNDGVYTISAVADPAKLYDISNRNSAQSTVYINISQPEKAMPYALLPAANVTSEASFDGTPYSLSIIKFLKDSYGVNVMHTQQFTGFDNVFFPFFNMTEAYVKNVSIAYAGYNNGDYAYSVWIRAYLNPAIVSSAEKGYGLNVSYKKIGAFNVTYAKLGSSTICSWYSEGWIKMLASSNNCEMLVNSTNTDTLQKVAYVPPYNMNINESANESEINATYSYLSGNVFDAGSVGDIQKIVIMPILSENYNTSQRNCYGTLSSGVNYSICNAYVSPVSSAITGTSLILTSKLTSNYNASAFILVNSSDILASIPYSEGFVNSLNITGTKVDFVSGFQNKCSFNNTFNCTNANFTANQLHLSISSMKKLEKINSIECYSQIPGKITIINSTFPSNNMLNLSVPCYTGSKQIQGIPISLMLTLKMNYTMNSTNSNVSGTADIFGI
jgi:lysozyme family protein